jgi:hypothetical protein
MGNSNLKNIKSVFDEENVPVDHGLSFDAFKAATDIQAARIAKAQQLEKEQACKWVAEYNKMPKARHPQFLDSIQPTNYQLDFLHKGKPCRTQFGEGCCTNDNWCYWCRKWDDAPTCEWASNFLWARAWRVRVKNYEHKGDEKLVYDLFTQWRRDIGWDADPKGGAVIEWFVNHTLYFTPAQFKICSTSTCANIYLQLSDRCIRCRKGMREKGVMCMMADFCKHYQVIEGERKDRSEVIMFARDIELGIPVAKA